MVFFKKINIFFWNYDKSNLRKTDEKKTTNSKEEVVSVFKFYTRVDAMPVKTKNCPTKLLS